MSAVAAKAYLEPYRKAVDAHGPTWGAQLWQSPSAQRARFEVLIEAAGLAGRSIADLGCGRADLAAYLVERGVGWGRYVGVEGVGAMAAEAGRLAAAWPRAEVLEGDFIADAGLAERLVRECGVDAVVVSGALNTVAQGQGLGVLGRYWEALGAGGVLAFNFLCDRPGAPAQAAGDPAVRWEASAALAWALERCGDVRYRRDYLGLHDATVVMRKGA